MKKLCSILSLVLVLGLFSLPVSAAPAVQDDGEVYLLDTPEGFIPVTKAQFDEFDANTDLAAFMQKHGLAVDREHTRVGAVMTEDELLATFAEGISPFGSGSASGPFTLTYQKERIINLANFDMPVGSTYKMSCTGESTATIALGYSFLIDPATLRYGSVLYYGSHGTKHSVSIKVSIARTICRPIAYQNSHSNGYTISNVKWSY